MKKEDIVKQSWFPAIKGANRDLIAAAGGIDRVAMLLQCSGALVGNWNNWDKPDLMPTWAIVVLEKDRGRSIVSRALALEAGSAVSEPVGRDQRPLSLSTDSAGMLTEVMEFITEHTLAFADGQYTLAELRSMRAKAIDLRDSGDQVLATIDRKIARATASLGLEGER
ncbi:MAG: hypothetical protein DI537_41415 [Stutzerimonas stutzeri]|nr:MAG: hypothetical protein DI537_41415 [Stutzerimonas stutzeri]